MWWAQGHPWCRGRGPGGKPYTRSGSWSPRRKDRESEQLFGDKEERSEEGREPARDPREQGGPPLGAAVTGGQETAELIPEREVKQGCLWGPGQSQAGRPPKCVCLPGLAFPIKASVPICTHCMTLAKATFLI